MLNRKALNTMALAALCCLPALTACGGSGEADAKDKPAATTQTFKGGNAQRSLSITLPKPLKSNTPFSPTIEGVTGKVPAGGLAGNFQADVYIVAGADACPSYVETYDRIGKGSESVIGIANVEAGPFRSVGQSSVDSQGTHRLCGYLAKGTMYNDFDTVVDEPITIAAGPEIGGAIDPVVPAGTYEAAAGAVIGGTSTTAVAVTVKGTPRRGRITRIEVKDAPPAICPLHPELTAPTTELISGTFTKLPFKSLPNEGLGDRMAASFRGKEQSSLLTLTGGSDGSREIRGAISIPTDDNKCAARLAFTATLRPGGGA